MKTIKYYNPHTINIESGEIIEWGWQYDKVHRLADWHEMAWWDEREVVIPVNLTTEDLLEKIERELNEPDPTY